MAFWVIFEGMILSTLEPSRKQSNVRNGFLGIREWLRAIGSWEVCFFAMHKGIVPDKLCVAMGVSYQFRRRG